VNSSTRGSRAQGTKATGYRRCCAERRRGEQWGQNITAVAAFTPLAPALDVRSAESENWCVRAVPSRGRRAESGRGRVGRMGRTQCLREEARSAEALCTRMCMCRCMCRCHVHAMMHMHEIMMHDAA
jgi:hypothetical protein